MKMIYIIVGLLVIALGVVYFLRKQYNSKNPIPEIQLLTKVGPSNNPYNDLRNLALSATAEQMGQLSNEKTEIYGVIMDWGLGEGTATLVAFKTGEASLYFSSGAGIIGGGGHDNVKREIAEYIKMAEGYLVNTSRTETTLLPSANEIKFYFLTNKGKYSGVEKMKNIESEKSDWLNLFEEANKLIAEIRIASEKAGNKDF
jgi:hypothetical protein